METWMKFFYYLFILILLCSLNETAFAKKKHKRHKNRTQHARAVYIAPSVYGTSQLAEQLQRVIQTENRNADIAVYVRSMEKGDVLFSYNIHQPLVPASTIKILTAEAALIYLGSEYRFSTQLLTDAKTVKNGILQGNLYVVLSGDPTLTYFDLMDLLLTLKSEQIYAIAGNVYIDNSAYDQRFYGPGWMETDKHNCYGAPISASIINKNCIPFKIAPSKSSGQSAQIITSPKYFYPRIKNSVVTKPHRSCAMQLSTDPGSLLTIDGCMSKGQYAVGVSYVVTDIPEYNRALFKTLLNRLSINVYGNVTFGSAGSHLSLIGSHQSKSLPLLITDMLKKSDNVIAGALFKKLGQLYNKQQGSWENGSIAVARILAAKAGMNTKGLRILDGSGVSHDNLTTAAQLMQVLNFAYHHYPISYEFISALPIAGVDGTLKHRMWNISRRVRAKTGTVQGVASLAGYVENTNKEPLAFVIMVNGSKGMNWRYREMEDKIATILARYQRV
jgi:serine-type D-Ala-D-Ala carboxypeptidase/endopeptidase (penicillin-binding protein 4)